METPGCGVSGPQPAILLAYAFHAWRIVMTRDAYVEERLAGIDAP
jgi:hypothetical protein